MEFQEASYVQGLDNKLTQHFMTYIIDNLVGSNENVRLVEYILFIDFLNMTKTHIVDFTFIERIIEKLNHNGSLVNFRPSLYYHVYLSLAHNYNLLEKINFKNLNVIPYIYIMSNEDHYDDQTYYLTNKITSNQNLMTYINDNYFNEDIYPKYLSHIVNLIKQENNIKLTDINDNYSDDEENEGMIRLALDIKLTNELKFNDMIYLCKLLDFDDQPNVLNYYNRKLANDILYYIVSNDMDYNTFITECNIKRIEITYKLLKTLTDKKILREFYDIIKHIEIIQANGISYYNLDAKLIADQLLELPDNDFMYLYDCGFIKMISNNFSLQNIVNNAKYSFTYIHKLNYLYSKENQMDSDQSSLRIKLQDERLCDFNHYPQDYISWANAYAINYYAYKVTGELCSYKTYIQKSRESIDGFSVAYQGIIQDGKFVKNPSGLMALVADGAQDYYLMGQKPPPRQVAYKLYSEKEMIN